MGCYCELKGLSPAFLKKVCKGKKMEILRPFFSFNKFSLIHGKKYKNDFKRKIVEIFSDNNNEKYLVTKDGTIYKEFDELSE
jgi:hypothetical protein